MDLLASLSETPRSGEAIAEELGVSRAAVSKAAKALISEGFPIVVDRANGYAVAPGAPTPAALAARGVSASYTYLAHAASTQDVLRAMPEAPTGAVVLSERQSAGRGRQARSWESVPGRSLTFSVLLRPTIPVASLGLLSLAAGIALADAVGHGSGVKWPNDLLARDGRKIAGVLTESQTVAETVTSVIVGVGVNVHGPAPAGGAAVDEFDPGVHRVDLLARILEHLDHRATEAAVDPDSLRAAWLDRSPMIGAQVTAATPAGAVTGLADGLDPTGALLVRTADATVPIHAGDVIQLRPHTKEHA